MTVSLKLLVRVVLPSVYYLSVIVMVAPLAVNTTCGILLYPCQFVVYRVDDTGLTDCGLTHAPMQN
jgi:hypothetical protein